MKAPLQHRVHGSGHSILLDVGHQTKNTIMVVHVGPGIDQHQAADQIGPQPGQSQCDCSTG
ncbi:hypothetical protein A5764_21040 [Mycobacterium sp. 852002-51057_SCH5723018]|nr:hypothetical protein A5764_21040 [Mycobacterium sp. 852002-51057_SCH5723018]